MKWEVHFIKIVEAETFFDAVEKVKRQDREIENGVSVCPAEIDYTQ